jgi:hypothetical protein
MAKLGKTMRVDRARAAGYLSVGRALHATARDLAELGEARYGNGLAIVAIHAAIAFTDALTVAYGEVKSTDGDHARAEELLADVLGPRLPAVERRRLHAILNAKSHVSYSGAYYTLADARKVLEKVDAFVAWASGVYESRPA